MNEEAVFLLISPHYGANKLAEVAVSHWRMEVLVSTANGRRRSCKSQKRIGSMLRNRWCICSSMIACFLLLLLCFLLGFKRRINHEERELNVGRSHQNVFLLGSENMFLIYAAKQRNCRFVDPERISDHFSLHHGDERASPSLSLCSTGFDQQRASSKRDGSTFVSDIIVCRRSSFMTAAAQKTAELHSPFPTPGPFITPSASQTLELSIQ